MFNTAFERPVGAAADVSELEYISALHQSGKVFRMDGSIKAEDIMMFLSSRYGIVVTEEEVRDTILRGLGGNNADETDNEVVDLMELTAILLIPVLLKASLQEDGGELPEGAVPTPRGILRIILKIIMHDVTGSFDARPLTPDLVKRILTAYGEIGLASDDKLVTEMVRATSSDQQSAEIEKSRLLDVDAFSSGLTYDIQLYDIRSECRLTTHQDDVFLTDKLYGLHGKGGNVPDLESDDNYFGLADREKIKASKPLKRKYTAPAIDITVGTYRSKILSVFLWATILFTYFSYYSGGRVQFVEDCVPLTFNIHTPWRANKKAMGCMTAESIIRWLFFFVGFSLFGLFFGGLGSIGNYVGCRHWWMPVIGMLVTILAVVGSFFGNQGVEKFLDETYLDTVALFLAMITVVCHFVHLLSILIPARVLRRLPVVSRVLNSSAVYAEKQIKSAAANKLCKMTQNALDIVQHFDEDSVLETYYGQSLHRYSRLGKRYEGEQVGGSFWVWRKLINGDAFNVEGLWYSVRLISSNIAQYLAVGYTLLFGIKMTNRVVEDFDEEWTKETAMKYFGIVVDMSLDENLIHNLTENVSSLVSEFILTASKNEELAVNCSSVAETGRSFVDDLCMSATNNSLLCSQTANTSSLCTLLETPDLTGIDQLGLLDASGLDVDALKHTVKVYLKEATDNTVDSLYPSSQYMLVVPMAFATAVAFLTALYLATSYIPSVTSTMLKLRCGEIPSLKDKEFYRYRIAVDLVAILTGSLFWGCLLSSAVVGGFVGLLIFASLWQVTAIFVLRFVALLIGITVCSLLRLIMVKLCRCSFYRAFYRRKPAAANISMLALEWASFALSAGFVMVRMFKLLIAAGMSIGRIDRQFVAQGAGRLGPIDLDNYPSVHLQDVLSHEAHRHPYIETLGVIYLMKLKYGESFGKTAGSCWRLLFVYALMPWMHEYRVQSRPGLLSSRGSLRRATLQDFVSSRNFLFEAEKSERDKEEEVVVVSGKEMHASDSKDDANSGTQGATENESPSNSSELGKDVDLSDATAMNATNSEGTENESSPSNSSELVKDVDLMSDATTAKNANNSRSDNAESDKNLDSSKARSIRELEEEVRRLLTELAATQEELAAIQEELTEREDELTI